MDLGVRASPATRRCPHPAPGPPHLRGLKRFLRSIILTTTRLALESCRQRALVLFWSMLINPGFVILSDAQFATRRI